MVARKPLIDGSVVVIGAGPAGLTAGYELIRFGCAPTILEASSSVGGIARTEWHNGYGFDIGGHRFFTKIPEVQRLWEEVMLDDFLKVRRMSRIHFRGRFFDYPLSVSNVLKNLGPVESARMVLSYFKAQLLRTGDEETFEQWVTNRFGGRLFCVFFKTYTERVWGMPCNQIRADWAAQRIKGLSFWSALTNAVFGTRGVKSLIEEFRYPKLGPGMMWEKFADRVEAGGGKVLKEMKVMVVRRDGSRITSVVCQNGQEVREFPADSVISSMPLTELVRKLDPPPPEDVLKAASGLRYRDFILVALQVDRAKLFPDNWIYVHTPSVKVGRIQNFGNWSSAMVADKNASSIGMEYFCNEGDELWATSDADLIALATRELATLGLANDGKVIGGAVIRQKKAYPVYDADYSGYVKVIRQYLDGFDNLQTVGRNGMHRYNNQDHSMLTAMLAVRNLMGAKHDLWEVNTERSYHEEMSVNAKRADAGPAHAVAPIIA
jgi:protoporphyrinogen oxidase